MIRENWNPKDQNPSEIATQMNLLPESFVDDNPSECEIVRNRLKGTAVPEIEQVEHYIEILDRSGF